MGIVLKLFLFCALLPVFSSALADDGVAVDPGNQARIRFFGQAVIGLEFYRNTTCYGGDAESETPSSKGFGGAFGSRKNISIGMPVTPNVTNLKERNGILAKAFYREYAIAAGEPITIQASYYATAGPRPFTYRNEEMSRGCEDMGASFVPEKGRDYEVTLDTGGRMCALNISLIAETGSGGVETSPIQTTPAKECEED